MTVPPYPRIIWSGPSTRIVQVDVDHSVIEFIFKDAMGLSGWVTQNTEIPPMAHAALVELRDEVNDLATKLREEREKPQPAQAKRQMPPFVKSWIAAVEGSRAKGDGQHSKYDQDIVDFLRQEFA